MSKSDEQGTPLSDQVRAMHEKGWRMPHTIPQDGTVVICAYRWSEGDRLRVTLGCWFKGGQSPGIVEAPDGPYIPCVGWMPLPSAAGAPK